VASLDVAREHGSELIVMASTRPALDSRSSCVARCSTCPPTATYRCSSVGGP